MDDLWRSDDFRYVLHGLAIIYLAVWVWDKDSTAYAAVSIVPFFVAGVLAYFWVVVYKFQEDVDKTEVNDVSTEAVETAPPEGAIKNIYGDWVMSDIKGKSDS